MSSATLIPTRENRPATADRRLTVFTPWTFGIGAALLALAAYPLGLSLPALSIEKFGRVREVSILKGCFNLFSEGNLFLGLVIGLTALMLPTVKLFGLVWLASAEESCPVRRRLAPILAAIGRWGFLDLFVAAVLVAWVQLGSTIRFEPRIGLIFFGFSILLSYLASICLEHGALKGQQQ